MGQKTHPIGFRLGIVKDWNSTWFTKKHFADWLNEDLLLRKYIMARVGNAGIATIRIKRFREKVTIIVATSRPGVVIGRKGAKADQLRAELQKMISKKVKLDVEEVKKPELSAPLVADHIAILPSRHEEGHRHGHAHGCQGHKDPLRRPPGWCRDGAGRVVPRRKRTAAHLAVGHRLRGGDIAHHVRCCRCEGVDLQG